MKVTKDLLLSIKIKTSFDDRVQFSHVFEQL